MTKERLNARGFVDKKHLMKFLEECKDKNWVEELKEYYGLTPKKEEIIEDDEDLDDEPNEGEKDQDKLNDDLDDEDLDDEEEK